jgi:hypothetical protein
LQLECSSLNLFNVEAAVGERFCIREEHSAVHRRWSGLDRTGRLSNRRQSEINKGAAPNLLPPVSVDDSMGPCEEVGFDSVTCGDAAQFDAVGRR